MVTWFLVVWAFNGHFQYIPSASQMPSKKACEEVVRVIKQKHDMGVETLCLGIDDYIDKGKK